MLLVRLQFIGSQAGEEEGSVAGMTNDCGEVIERDRGYKRTGGTI